MIMTPLAYVRAVSTDIVSFLARVAVTLTERPHPPSGVDPCRRSDDDRSHENGGSPGATLGPSAPGSRPTHWGLDHRHGSRRSALDGAWVARCGADSCDQCRRRERHRGAAPARDSEAPTTCRETRRSAPVGAGPAADFRFPALTHTSAGGRSQAAGPAGREASTRVHPVASGPAGPAS